MADKKSNKRTVSTPKMPPKKPLRDYSAMPQKQISLKRKTKKKLAPVTQNATIRSKPSTTNKKKAPKAAKAVKKKSPNRWDLKGLSDEAKQAVIEEANQQGMSITDWIEQLIMSSRNLEDKPAPENEQQLTIALRAIEQRLDRIEQQRGFWSRLWDQAMDQK
ncbi:MAG: hypothetical protein KZQ78_15280 [Candidatus Thiodiazotropha sp. (ex Ustalcina ferruginea)]|nr:hypothetical protein [Candidatus Thiodiazotropha sp. (ex Ustalcina ferruginea)]